MAGERLLVTCEHGGNEVPERFRALFADCEALLDTHRGFDPGALAMAQAIASAFDAPLVASTTSRLLVDLNRSLGNPRLFSQATRRAPPEARQEILEACYLPYRQAVEREVERIAESGERIVHVSSHSFTPVLDGEVRHADIGLLYDPARAGELAFCRHWEAAFRRHAPQFVVRRNYPYAGRADGLTTALRRLHGPDTYVGVELEINQRFALQDPLGWERVRDAVIATLGDALAAGDGTLLPGAGVTGEPRGRRGSERRR